MWISLFQGRLDYVEKTKAPSPERDATNFGFEVQSNEVSDARLNNGLRVTI